MRWSIAWLGLLVIVFLAPSVAADPMATVFHGRMGERCYVFWNGDEFPEYWMESNGVATGGVPEGSPATGPTGAGSGLQRIAFPAWGAADTQLNGRPSWLEACNLDDG